jgi:hypothetical protein
VREGEVAAGDRCAVAEPGQRNEGHPWQARRGSPSRVMNGRVALAHGDKHRSSQVGGGLREVRGRCGGTDGAAHQAARHPTPAGRPPPSPCACGSAARCRRSAACPLPIAGVLGRIIPIRGPAIEDTPRSTPRHDRGCPSGSRAPRATRSAFPCCRWCPTAPGPNRSRPSFGCCPSRARRRSRSHPRC